MLSNETSKNYTGYRYSVAQLHKKPKVEKDSSQGDLWEWLLSDVVDYKVMNTKAHNVYKGITY